jgi:hypothetical protein
MKLGVIYPSKYFFCIFICLTISSTYSQSEETKRLLSEIEGYWQKDDNGNVTYTKVIENINLPKDSIYNRIQEYCNFNYHYGNFNYYYGENSSIIEDKEKGIFKAKGYYRKTYYLIKPVYSIVSTESVTNINTMHELKIDIKENRVVIYLKLNEYDYSVELSLTSKQKSFLISKTYPVNPKRAKWKNMFGEAFYESHQRVQKSLLDIESAIREGVVEGEKY